MNIQIFGKKKCFETKKAERYFKERGIKFQRIALEEKGLSKGEFNSVRANVKSLDELIDYNSKSDTATLIKYLSNESDKVEKLLENPMLFKTPIVRNGKAATVGYCPDIWKTWE